MTCYEYEISDMNVYADHLIGGSELQVSSFGDTPDDFISNATVSYVDERGDGVVDVRLSRFSPGLQKLIREELEYYIGSVRKDKAQASIDYKINQAIDERKKS